MPLINCYVCDISNGKKVGRYKGDYWENGRPHGTGTTWFDDGREYTGEFRNGDIDGMGTMLYHGGRMAKFCGMWKNGCKYIGKITYYDGRIEEGMWIEEKINSYRTTDVNGKIQINGKIIDNKNNIYEGEIKNGEIEGFGKMIYANGIVYEGNWKNGKKAGGIWKKDFNMYEGEFKNDEFDGFAGSHQNDMVKNKIIQTGNKYLFSIPYQHYTNAIENFFSQLKHYLKLNKPSSSFTQIKTNINNALKNIKKENYKNYIENSYKKKEKR